MFVGSQLEHKICKNECTVSSYCQENPSQKHEHSLKITEREAPEFSSSSAISPNAMRSVTEVYFDEYKVTHLEHVLDLSCF